MCDTPIALITGCVSSIRTFSLQLHGSYQGQQGDVRRSVRGICGRPAKVQPRPDAQVFAVESLWNMRWTSIATAPKSSLSALLDVMQRHTHIC